MGGGIAGPCGVVEVDMPDNHYTTIQRTSWNLDLKNGSAGGTGRAGAAAVAEESTGAAAAAAVGILAGGGGRLACQRWSRMLHCACLAAAAWAHWACPSCSTTTTMAKMEVEEQVTFLLPRHQFQSQVPQPNVSFVTTSIAVSMGKSISTNNMTTKTGL